MSETATFCAVCGARFDAPEIQSMTESTAPVAVEAAGVPFAEAAAEPVVAGLAPEPEPAEAVEPEPQAETAEPQAEATEPHSEAAEPQAEAAEPPIDEPTAEEPEEDPVERRLGEVAALLDEAAGTEDADAGRAAALYGDAIVACLDATEDPLASEDVRPVLLSSFDRLSSLLERGGLPEEALSVVDDAASLGLLNGGDGARTEHRDSLRDRRENLRRILFADSARL